MNNTNDNETSINIPCVNDYSNHINITCGVYDIVDGIFSHNSEVALWYTNHDDPEKFLIQFWKGMAWNIPIEYRNLKFKKIFGTIPEDIMDADIINIEVEYSEGI